MVELRKRPAPPAAPPPAKKKATAKAKAEPKSKKETAPAAASSKAPSSKMNNGSGSASVGDSIDVKSFGGEVQTNDDKTVTLASLLDESKAGVVLFTYPKASTPGCTTQVCLFRDSYDALTTAGLAVYGLSNDSPKANTTFKTKQNLPYSLLCDPKQTLIGAIGMKKEGNKTTRGVFVVDKSGKVLAAEPGGPAATLDVVKAVIAKMGGDTNDKGVAKAEEKVGSAENKRVADVAAEVADEAQAAKLDRSKASTPVV